jgi:hypothetical protein
MSYISPYLKNPLPKTGDFSETLRPLSSFAIFRHFVGFLCGLLGCLSTGAAAETLVIHWVGRVKAGTTSK